MRGISILLLACLIPLQVRADTPRELRLRAVDRRLAALDSQRSAAGPIALIAIGGMSAGVALSAPLFVWLAPTFAGTGRPGTGMEVDAELIRWSTGLSLIGVAIAAGGGIWLSRRLHARRALAPERQELLEERERLRREVRLHADAGGASLALRVRF